MCLAQWEIRRGRCCTYPLSRRNSFIGTRSLHVGAISPCVLSALDIAHVSLSALPYHPWASAAERVNPLSQTSFNLKSEHKMDSKDAEAKGQKMVAVLQLATDVIVYTIRTGRSCKADLLYVHVSSRSTRV